MESPYEELDFTKNTEDEVYLNDVQKDSLCEKKRPDVTRLKQNQPRYANCTLRQTSFSQQTPGSLTSQNDCSINKQASPSSSLVYLNDVQKDSLCEKKRPDLTRLKQNQPRYATCTLGQTSFSQQTPGSLPSQNDCSINKQTSPSSSLDVTVKPPNGILLFHIKDHLSICLSLSLVCNNVLASVCNFFPR